MAVCGEGGAAAVGDLVAGGIAAGGIAAGGVRGGEVGLTGAADTTGE